MLREAFYGVRRFDDFQADLGCARNVPSARLATLVEFGVLSRRPYHEPGHRERVEYHPTEKGTELFPVLIALMAWGDRWAAPSGAPVEIRHRDCDALVRVAMHYDEAHGPLSVADVDPAPGPGARAGA